MVRALAHLVLDERRVADGLHVEAVALEQQRLHVVADRFVVVDDEDAYSGELGRHLYLTEGPGYGQVGTAVTVEVCKKKRFAFCTPRRKSGVSSGCKVLAGLCG